MGEYYAFHNTVKGIYMRGKIFPARTILDLLLCMIPRRAHSSISQW